MRKQDFIKQLRKKLHGLSPVEIEERVTFYSEMIDDRVEEGASEADAVADIRGQLDSVLPEPSVRPRKGRSTWEIILLIVGSPVWLSLLVAAFAVVLSLYVSAWAVLISLWATVAAMAVSGFIAVIGGIVLAVSGNIPTGIALTGAALVCLGLSIFFFFGCKYLTAHSIALTQKLFHRLSRKEIVR